MESAKIETLVAEILGEMTLGEKISLCHGNSLFYVNAIPRNLSFWDVVTHNWKAEPGTFEIQVGNSSRNLAGEAQFELK